MNIIDPKQICRRLFGFIKKTYKNLIDVFIVDSKSISSESTKSDKFKVLTPKSVKSSISSSGGSSKQNVI